MSCAFCSADPDASPRGPDDIRGEGRRNDEEEEETGVERER
jgi:hypothetical protein